MFSWIIGFRGQLFWSLFSHTRQNLAADACLWTSHMCCLLSDSSVKHKVHIDICGILFSEKCWKTGTLPYDHFLPFFKSLLQWKERSKNLDLAVFQCLCLGHCDHVIHKSVCPALFWFAWGANGGFPYKNFITSHRPTVKKSAQFPALYVAPKEAVIKNVVVAWRYNYC